MISEPLDLQLLGCRLQTMQQFQDARGVLCALDLRNGMGFDASRTFVVTLPDDETGVTRAGHANSTPEVLVALSGQVTVDLDAGFAQATVVLDRPDLALLVGPGVVIHLRLFAKGTILLGLAEAPYAETVQYPVPQPDLILRVDPETSE